MEQPVETQPVADAFDAAVTAESSYVEPAASTDTTLDDTAQTARDDKGRFASTKPAAVAVDEDADAGADEKPKGKPRNDLQARIDQLTWKQHEAERRADEAERRAQDREREIQSLRAPKQEPAKQATPELFPRFDAWSASNPDKTHDDYLNEWYTHNREQERKQERDQQDKTRREQAFSTRAAGFSERFATAKQADPDVEGRIDRKFLTAKPLSTLTKEDRALISAIPDPKAREDFAFLCFLADQWIDSEHAVAVLEHISDPAHFQRLATLPPDRVIRELATFEADLRAASPKDRGSAQRSSASQAHPPIKPLGSAPRVPDADDGSDDEPIEAHIRRENAKDRKSGRLG